MPAAYKIKTFLTGQMWAPGEVHGADEFPPETDFARLLETGAIRDMPGNETHGGDPKVIDLLDQVEDLSKDLSICKEAASAQAAQLTGTIAAKDKEIATLKQELSRAQAKSHTEHVGAEKRVEDAPRPDEHHLQATHEKTPHGPAGTEEHEGKKSKR